MGKFECFCKIEAVESYVFSFLQFKGFTLFQVLFPLNIYFSVLSVLINSFVYIALAFYQSASFVKFSVNYVLTYQSVFLIQGVEIDA